MKKNVVIIAGGDVRDAKFIKNAIADLGVVTVICADGGLGYLSKTELLPDLIIGDMDSVNEAALEHFARRGSRIERHPVRKDETDMELALESALAMKPCRIVILGALGGRIDHALANVFLLLRAAERGVDAVIRDEACDLFVVKDRREIQGAPGDTVSLLALSAEASGITLEGFEYPLDDAAMKIGVPLGISNSLAASSAVITVKTGYLLAVRFFGEVK